VSHMGRAMPAQLAEKYVREPVTEYECRASGLRWFAPALLGGPDYYEWLGESFDWYYLADSWDKREALEVLRRRGCKSVIEVGSGDGTFLAAAARNGLTSTGVEINELAIERSRRAGFRVLRPSELGAAVVEADSLVLLQSLEHVSEPLGFLRSLLELVPVRRVVVAVPCFEALVGHSSHPLLWPPHHATFWSAQGLQTLASLLGFRVDQLRYDRPSFGTFLHWRSLEACGRLVGIPALPPNRLGKLLFLAYANVLRTRWARRFHTVLAVFERG
jgi:SAM-dependent methyltransferase